MWQFSKLEPLATILQKSQIQKKEKYKLEQVF